jgi:hypothetical protein
MPFFITSTAIGITTGKGRRFFARNEVLNSGLHVVLPRRNTGSRDRRPGRSFTILTYKKGAMYSRLETSLYRYKYSDI